MAKIKICGIKRFEDIIAINEAKPDYIGFVFAKSKRRVSPEQAHELIAMLSPRISVAGVFVNEGIRAAAAVAKSCPLDVIQLHGDENADYIRKLRGLTHKEIWKAVRVRSGRDIEDALKLGADRLLLDAYSEDVRGGGGVMFNHDILDGFDTGEFVVAGGINLENIAETIETLKPFAVDVSSGAETGGVKDAEKIAKLVEIARRSEED